MNRYKVTIRDVRDHRDSERIIEAKSAQDAFFMADFNTCQKSRDFEGNPTSHISHIEAVNDEAADSKKTLQTVDDYVHELAKKDYGSTGDIFNEFNLPPDVRAHGEVIAMANMFIMALRLLGKANNVQG